MQTDTKMSWTDTAKAIAASSENWSDWEAIAVDGISNYSMPDAVEVKALGKYSIHVVFSDGVEGTVDLGHLAHKGVFQRWDTDDLFAQVHIDEYGAIAWNDEIDICPDSVWLQLSNLTFEQWQQQNRRVHATNQ